MCDGPPPPPATPVHRIGNHDIAENWPVTGESARCFVTRLRSGFYAAYMAGDVILDIGYRGGLDSPVQVFPHAIGVDIDYPGYDGSRLPFDDGSVDAVYSSHVLEHIVDPVATIRDWYRVLRIGGFIVCTVPHQFLYEKREQPPSRWNGDHKRFYTPGSLLREFEAALEPNTYRVRHLCDGDAGYSYEVGPEGHAEGQYEIELVIEKRERPSWTLEDNVPPLAEEDLEPPSSPEEPRASAGFWRLLIGRLAR